MDPSLVFQSKKLRELIVLADRYALTDFPVLIVGESGVGKELFARRVHGVSRRRHYRFIPLNCAAVPYGLFESELFGFEKGAFSGAVQSYKGLFKQAHLGTLLFDEIGELDLSLQVKLLRVLDSGEFRPLGSSGIDQVNVRLICATNVDLNSAIRERAFRLDLLQRISVLVLRIPPLRERKEDIEPIARHCLGESSSFVSQDCIDQLCRYDWPGNVRQLRNVLQRVAAISDAQSFRSVLHQVMSEERLTDPLSSSISLSNGNRLADVERRMILESLKRFQGNRKRAAEELGIAKSTLHEKLRRWKREEPEDVSWPLHRFGAFSPSPFEG